MIKQIFGFIFEENEKRFEIGDLGDPSNCNNKKNEDNDPYLESHKKFILVLRKFQIYDFSEVSKHDIKILSIKLFRRLLESEKLYTNHSYLVREVGELRKLTRTNGQVYAEIEKLLAQEDRWRFRHKVEQDSFFLIYFTIKHPDGDGYISDILQHS